MMKLFKRHYTDRETNVMQVCQQDLFNVEIKHMQWYSNLPFFRANVFMVGSKELNKFSSQNDNIVSIEKPVPVANDLGQTEGSL